MKTNGLRWHSLKKMMNIFTGDLYSMYVVLQGIGSPSCIIIIYVASETSTWAKESQLWIALAVLLDQKGVNHCHIEACQASPCL